MNEMCKYYKDQKCFIEYDDTISCFCEGDRCKCDFYSDIRNGAIIEESKNSIKRSTEILNDISDILKRMDETIKNIGEALEDFKEVNE